MKLFNIPALILILFIAGNVSVTYAPDSTKKAAVVKPSAVQPVAVKPVAKAYPPVKKYATYRKPVVLPDTQKAAVVPSPVAAPADKSLYGQYAYLQTKVYNYQRPLVAALYKNYMDTLALARRNLKAAQATLATQAKTIDTLKSAASNKDQTLNESQAKVDEVSFLGMPVSKSTYNLIMWGLVLVFGAIAGIVIAKSGSYSREANYRIKLYNELEEEHKAYKAKANEKEKKLARELQTERNKVDELLGKG